MSRSFFAFPFVVGCLLVLACTVAGCGYSEDQWQAQLAKYGELQASSAARGAELERQIAAEQQRVGELEKQLQGLGVDLEAKNSEVSKLSSTLEEREKALAEYRTRAKQLERIRARFELLRKKLDDLTKFGLEVSIRGNRMIVSLPGDVVFDSGKDTLRKEGEDILKEVAKVIRADRSLLERDYQVAGHTDTQPLQGGVFRDNWGLSLMRARAVLLYLVGREGNLPRQRWSAAGYADTAPVAANGTRDGQQKNRRCEIVVLPDVDEMLDLKEVAK